MALSDAVPFAVAHWPFDSDFNDTIGSNHLTDNNTVGSAVGKFGNGADFESSNTESLSIVDNASLSIADDTFSMRFWIKFESLSTHAIISKATGTNGTSEYLVFYTSNRLRFRLYTSVTFFDIAADNAGVLSTGTWYLVHVWHNKDTDIIGISVNAGTANTTTTGGLFPSTTSTTFRIGNWDSGVSLLFDGIIDDLVFLRGYILDADERTADYNGGVGVPFSDWATSGGGIIYPANYGLFEGAVFPFGN